MSDAFDTPHDPKLRRKRLIAQVLLWTAGLVPVIAGVGLWIVTRSWFIILITAPMLEQKLGGPVRIGNASYRGNGTLVFEDLIVFCPGLEGPGAQALRIARAEVVILPTTLLSGVTITEVRLDGVLLRLSEDRREPGLFNFSLLNPNWAGGGARPPTVRIESAVIEVGTHTDGQYRPSGQRRVTGEMYAAGDGGARYDFRLQELDENGESLGRHGLSIKGSWDVETMEHTAWIEGLTLDDRMREMCPQMARLWWERVDPRGSVTSAEIKWSKGEPYSATLKVAELALTIPLGAHELSANYQIGPESMATMPRMFVDEGTIHLAGGQLTLENLHGYFRSSDDKHSIQKMKYRVNFSIHDMAPFDWENPQDWMEQVLKTAPFEMSTEMNNFRLDEKSDEAPQPVQLPPAVADTLAKFNLSGWSLTTQVKVARAAPEIGPDGRLIAAPIKTTGQAFIKDAVGAFQGFPYPLENVEIRVTFDTDRVIIDYLTAEGSQKSQLRMSGWIAPPGRNAAISLRLTARGVPLDDRFRQGLTETQRATFDVMLHKPSFEALKAEGLLPDEATIEAAGAERRQVQVQLDRLLEAPGAPDTPETQAERKRLTREMERLNTLLDMGPFELGGKIDLDLLIERQPGPDSKILITGGVKVHHAGIVYGRFAYPIYVGKGELNVYADRIVIADGPSGKGIDIATPGGGRGTVSGEVRLVPTPQGPRVEPALSIDLHQDALSDLLYAAMPLTDQDRKGTQISALRPVPRRSLIARLLAGAGLSGWLNHTGLITSDDQGRPTFDFAVELYDATAEPNEELFETMKELGLPSPKGLNLQDVHALVQITPDTVRLVDFTGHRGSAVITADADVNLKADPIETEMRVDFDNLDIERYLIELTPGDARRTTAELWDRYQPQGKYDAKLRYLSRGDEAEQAQLTLWPRELKIMVDGEPLWLVADRGRIVLRRGQVTFGDFLLGVRSGNRDEGSIALDGSYGIAADGKALRLEGFWTGGDLASPMITEVLELIGATAHARRYREYAPTGKFDADFFFQSGHGEEPADYEFTVHPSTLGIRINDIPIFADMAPGSEVTFWPGRIELRDVTGEHAGGTFVLNGQIDTTGLLAVDLDIGYHGRVDSPQLMALLPAPVHGLMKTLDLQAAEAVRLSNARLQLAQVDSVDNTWSILFHGVLETKGASLNLGGLKLTEIDAVLDIQAQHDPDRGTGLLVDIHAARALAIDRELTDLRTQVSMSPGTRTISVPEFRARMYGGIVTGYATVGLDENTEYEAVFDIGAVSLEGILSPTKAATRRATNASGELYASLRTSGLRGDPETRRGRGAVRVAYGRMADMPVALRILQLFELMPPVSGTLDYAEIEFYINGDHLVMERLYMECPTLQLLGEGEMLIPGFELDLRLRTRGTLPVFRDLVAAVSNTLFEVEITGPLTAPKAKLIPLPGIGQSNSHVSEPQVRADR